MGNSGINNDFLAYTDNSKKIPIYYIVLVIIAGLLCFNSFVLFNFVEAYEPSANFIYTISFILELIGMLLFLVLLIKNFTKAKLITFLLMIIFYVLCIVFVFFYKEYHMDSLSDSTGWLLASFAVASYSVNYILKIVNTIMYLVSYKK